MRRFREGKMPDIDDRRNKGNSASGNMMFVTCRKRELYDLVDEFDDWVHDGFLRIVLYGATQKAHDGFLLIEWLQPIPETFCHKLKQDNGITDYLIYEAPGSQPA